MSSPPGAPRPISEQMEAVLAFAMTREYEDVVKWLNRHFPWHTGEGHCCPPTLTTYSDRVQRIYEEERPGRPR